MKMKLDYQIWIWKEDKNENKNGNENGNKNGNKNGNENELKKMIFIHHCIPIKLWKFKSHEIQSREQSTRKSC